MKIKMYAQKPFVFILICTILVNSLSIVSFAKSDSSEYGSTIMVGADLTTDTRDDTFVEEDTSLRSQFA